MLTDTRILYHTYSYALIVPKIKPLNLQRLPLRDYAFDS